MTTTDATSPTSDSITPTELAARLGDPNLTIVDVRPIAAYNGWRLRGERARRPHPGRGRRSRWRGCAAWTTPEVDRQLADKGVTTGPADRRLRRRPRRCRPRSQARLGAARPPRRRASSTPGSPAWAADETLPARATAALRAARPHRLAPRRCSPAGARRPPDGGEYPAAPRQLRGPRGVRGGPSPGRALPRHQPARGSGRLEPPLARRDRGDPRWRSGSPHDTTVIVYGRDTEGDANEKWPGRRAGQIAATRAALILRYAGVDDVRLLDGGYDWWVTAGHPLETVIREPVAGRRLRGRRSRSGPTSSSTSTRRRRSSPTRTGRPSSASGPGASTSATVSGYNYIGPAGRIKGDVWGNCGTDAYHMQHYRNVDNTMRAYPEIAANWAEAGITPDKWVAFYCGTGWRASRDLVLRGPAGLAAHRRLRRRLVRVERRPGQQPDRDRRADRRDRRAQGVRRVADRSLTRTRGGAGGRATPRVPAAAG